MGHHNENSKSIHPVPVNVTTLDAVRYGVEDMDEARRFWIDFGLSLIEDGPEKLLFRAQDGSTVEVLPADDGSLPASPVGAASTLREPIFGVRAVEDLESIAAELSKDRDVVEDDEGVLHAVDPLGFGVGFRVSRCAQIAVPDPQFNMPGRVGRLNKRGRFYRTAQPVELTHLVYLVSDLEKERRFYSDRLGFRVTDSYRNRAYFLRGGASHNHHNLFLLDAGGRAIGFHHLAFEVSNIHELFGGGLNMTRRGWKTMLGPGRHPISSCYFWYFHNPCGGGAEYDFDSDVVDDDWVAGEFEQTPEHFAEWCLAAGMEESLLYTGVQTGETIKHNGVNRRD